MLRTPLYEWHVRAGARMIEFSGYEMPVLYKGIIEEHRCVRSAVGIFDVSHMGQFLIKGEGATEFVNYFQINNFKDTSPWKLKYTHILNENGKIIDDTIITKISEQKYFMVPNGAMIKTDYEWLEKVRKMKKEFEKVVIINYSDSYSCLAVQGPKSEPTLQKIVEFDLKTMKSFHKAALVSIKTGASAAEKTENVLEESGPMYLISRTGYTGEDGFEIICHNRLALPLWEAIMEAGKEFGIQPIGLGARDTLRLEKGFLLSGTDFSFDRTTYETGVDAWGVLKLDHEFIGKEKLEEQKKSGNYQRFVGFKLLEKGIPRHGMKVFADGKEVGILTSGTMSPSLNIGIALGYINPEYAKKDTDVEIEVRNNKVKAKVVFPPFV